METIFVVDDDEMNRVMVESMLTERYQVVSCDSGAELLQRLDQGPPCDLILLDILMPEMDGYEVCRRLKAHPLEQVAQVPVIFFTSLEGDHDQSHGLEIGAVDYITKPLNHRILHARVESQLRLYRASRQLQQQNSDLRRQQEVISNVVNVLRRSDRYYSRNLKTLVAPLELSNGDVLLSARGPDRHQMILQGDFMGHGLQAAVCVPLVAYIFYDMVDAGRTMAEVLQELNGALHRQLPTNYFLCAHALELSATRDTLRYWNFASPDLLCFRGDRVVHQVASDALPLGVQPRRIEHSEGSLLPVNQGDRVCFFTDGVVETRSPDGEAFGFKRVRAFLAEEKDTLEDLMLELLQFAGESGPHDDITVAELTI